MPYYIQYFKIHFFWNKLRNITPTPSLLHICMLVSSQSREILSNMKSFLLPMYLVLQPLVLWRSASLNTNNVCIKFVRCHLKVCTVTVFVSVELGAVSDACFVGIVYELPSFQSPLVHFQWFFNYHHQIESQWEFVHDTYVILYNPKAN
jgi:hypothetical protein